MLTVAMLSVHTCPLAPLGGWETGGMNVYVRELARHLGERNVRVDVFTRRQAEEPPTIREFAANARVVHLDAGPPAHIEKYQVLQHLPQFACGLRRFREQHGLRYDVIHSHYWLSGRVAAAFHEREHLPVVAMFHTLALMKNRVSHSEAERESEIRVAIERHTMQIADRVIAATPADQQQMVRLYGAAPSKISVIPCGVDLERFRPQDRGAARRALGLGDQPVALFVGRIQQLKGVEVLLRATALLARQQPDLGLQAVIVGGRPESDAPDDPEAVELRRLQRLAAELGVTEQVRWVGAVDHADLPRYYAAADVTVMPSLYESFGLVAVESMACGTPVVAAAVGGLRSTVADGESGYLIPWRHPQLYADRIAAIARDRRLRERLATGAIATARRFAWPTIAERVLEVYEAAIAERLPLVGSARSLS